MRRESGPGMVGVVGAGSFVARHLARALQGQGIRVAPWSRSGGLAADVPPLDWVVCAPVWSAPDVTPRLDAFSPRRVVVLSSMSVISKAESLDPVERALAQRLAQGEAAWRAWAESRGVSLAVVRPTMIYGPGDRNVSRLAAWLRRMPWCPLWSEGAGLRQPVRVEDLAAALVVLVGDPSVRGTFSAGGGEVLPFRCMVERIATAYGRRVRFVRLCRWPWRALLAAGSFVLPRFGLRASMLRRTEEDLLQGEPPLWPAVGLVPGTFRFSGEEE
ncbi:MAG: NAD-dependent epimerase/dehydratase family protein [Tepidiphilus sp.]|nr:NAD-dependent epimerase/dehydratase family protein [Tepidiphilus sp.]